MLSRILLAAVAMLATTVLVPAMYAAEKEGEKTHEGWVVSVAEGKLTMADQDGKNEHTHLIGSAGVKITLNGKAAALNDLAKGDHVNVTTNAEGKVSAVAAKREAKKE